MSQFTHIDTAQVNALISNANSIYSNLQSIQQNMTKEGNDVPSFWVSDAATGYSGAFTKLAKDIQTFLNNNKSFIDNLAKVSKDYDAEEDGLLELVDGIADDTIPTA